MHKLLQPKRQSIKQNTKICSNNQQQAENRIQTTAKKKQEQTGNNKMVSLNLILRMVKKTKLNYTLPTRHKLRIKLWQVKVNHWGKKHHANCIKCKMTGERYSDHIYSVCLGQSYLGAVMPV